MSLASCYAELTTPWGEKASYYTRPQGHSGADYDADVGDPVLAYEDITITRVEWSRFIGWCVEGRARDGKYIGWAHLRGVTVEVGDNARKGTDLAEVAGYGDSPGTTWFGPHIHTTLGDHSGAIFEGMTIDPAPRIRAALAAAPAGGRPSTLVKEADVAKHRIFQSPQDFIVRPQWQRFPWRVTPDRQENLAQGTGGAGLYDILLNLYLKKFGATAQIEGRLVIENARTKKTSNGYLFTVDGSPTGEVRVAIPARVNVPSGSLLYLELHTLRGPEPTLDLWGADIANLGIPG